MKVCVSEHLFWFRYPFQLPKSFMVFEQKNDLRLKIRLIKALAINRQNKSLDLEKLFSTVNVSNTNLIKIKKQTIKLLKELVKHKIIHNQLETIYKSDRKKQILLESITISNITRRVKYLNFSENIDNFT